MALPIEIELPFSKSISNRLLIVQALSGSSIRLDGISDSTDTVRLSTLLNTSETLLDAGDGGTTLRFLLPVLCMREGEFVLTGTERMKQRPIADLVNALRSIGAEITYEGEEGFPPLRIKGGVLIGDTLKISSGISSQFVSALMLVAPFLKAGLLIRVDGERVSASYIEMTVKLLEGLGIRVERTEDGFKIASQKVRPQTVSSERDWSAAAFWYQLAASQAGSIFKLKGLGFSGLQGDQILADYFSRLGVKTTLVVDGVLIENQLQAPTSAPLEFNLRDTPDIAPSLILACFALKQPAEFTGISHLQYKESDRMSVIAGYLTTAGAEVEYDGQRFCLRSFKEVNSRLTIDPHNDHRIAMSFAMLGISGHDVQLLHAEVVRKSYPGFWQQLYSAGFNLASIGVER